METTTVYWIAVAFVAGAVAKGLRLPTLVGYIAAGLVLAAFGVEADALIIDIGDVGIAVLLFTVGLHIRLKNILRPEVLGVGSLHLVASALLFTVIGLLFGLSFGPAVLLAVALGFSSTVLTAKTLEGRLDSYQGRVAIGILILQDVVAIGLLAVTGAETPTPWALLLIGLPLLRAPLIMILDAIGRDELMLVFALLLAFGVGEVFALVGLSAKLGALVAGVLLAGHAAADDLYDKLWGLKEVFLVGFFLQVGLAGVPDLEGLLMVGVLLLLLPLKTALFFWLLTRFQLRARTAFMTGISLTAYSEFALIVATGAGDAIPAEWVTNLALLVAVSFALNAPISRAVDGLWMRLEGRLHRFERNLPHPERTVMAVGSTTSIVVGMGRVGVAAYDYLVEHGCRPMGIDADPARIEHLLASGRRVIYGESGDAEFWLTLPLDNIQRIILAIPNVHRKAQASAILREQGYRGQISALVRDEEAPGELLAAGVNSLTLPLAQAGHELARLSLEGAT